jgi:hypothetical protein
MTKNKEFTEVLGILEDVYGWNDTNELTEMQAELVNDVISVVKKLTIPDVVVPKGTLCETCNKLDEITITLCKECYLESWD